MKIYGDQKSGNCYKIQLVCALLDIPYEWQPVNILRGETHTPEFLAINPNGKIPAVVLDDGRCLSESNAIVNYLARDSALLSQDPYQLALIQQWQFFEQYSHEPFIAVRRFIALYLGLPEARRAEYEHKLQGGEKALGVMERQLAETDFLVGKQASVADICLFAYTHVAEDGGFDLSKFPAVQAWLDRVKALPGFVPMAS